MSDLHNAVVTSQKESVGVGGKILIWAVVALLALLAGGYALVAYAMTGWADSYDTGSSQQVSADPPRPDVAPGYERDRATSGGSGSAEELPDDATEKVRTALVELPWNADARRAEDDAVRAVTAALPASVIVQAEQEPSALVVTAAAPEARDCVVVVKPADGDPYQFSDFDRILLEPGEGGCGPYLYLRPVKTH